eukprot:278561_1
MTELDVREIKVTNLTKRTCVIRVDSQKCNVIMATVGKSSSQSQSNKVESSWGTKVEVSVSGYGGGVSYNESNSNASEVANSRVKNAPTKYTYSDFINLKAGFVKIFPGKTKSISVQGKLCYISVGVEEGNSARGKTVNIIQDNWCTLKSQFKFEEIEKDQFDLVEAEVRQNTEMKDDQKVPNHHNVTAYGQFARLTEFTTNGKWTMLSMEKVLYNKNIDLKNGGFGFKFPGMYKMSIGYRGGAGNDVWTTLWVKDEDGNVVGMSNKFGNFGDSPTQHTIVFLVKVEKEKINHAYTIDMGRYNGSPLKIKKVRWDTDIGPIKNSNATCTVVIEYVGAL